MTRKDRLTIKHCAEVILKMYLEQKDILERSHVDEFRKSAALQGYRDSLEAMKRDHLIRDYHLVTGIITMEEKS